MTSGLPRVRGTAAAVFFASIALVAVCIWAAGYDASRAGSAAWNAAFGSPFAFFSGTLKRATPLLTLGIAISVAFRAGVLNIGADGQFLAGAAASVAVALTFSSWPRMVLLPMELLVGACAGAAWAGGAAVLKRRYAVGEVVSTLLLNFVATNLIGYLVRGPLQEPSHSYPQTPQIAPAGRLPILLPGQRLHWGFVIAVAVAIGAWWFFQRTAAGFRMRVVGASPSVAYSAGLIDVGAVQARALIASGAIAGLAGCCEVAGVTYGLYEGLSPGYGYTAIAVALLGGLGAGGVVVSALLFGALAAGADGMQRDAGIPPEFASIAAAMMILGMLIASTVQRARGAAPAPIRSDAGS